MLLHKMMEDASRLLNKSIHKVELMCSGLSQSDLKSCDIYRLITRTVTIDDTVECYRNLTVITAIVISHLQCYSH